MAQGASISEAPVRRTIPVTNPATGARLAEYPVADREAVAVAVARAREAQARWAALGFAERGKILRRARDRFVDEKDRICDVVSGETGKPRHDVITNELLFLCDAIGFWSKRAGKYLADEPARPHLLKNKRVYVSYTPHGVVGIIGPWNFPFNLTIGEVIPALMAGNAVVIKPSEVTPGSAELGGKDPMIVLGDADLERASSACVYGGLVNAGQVCISVERVYVEAPVYDAFVGKVVDKVRRVRQGPPDAGVVEVGSMTFPPQIEKVERHVQDAVARGAKVLAGGKRRTDLPGLYFEPTVLVDVDHDMDVMRDETFGPVIPIMRVRDEEEAIRLANDSRYGLDASVWTRDLARGARVARRVQSGAVCVNDVLVNYAVTEVPMGGWKESGIGYRHGPGGIRKFCAQQSVVIDRFGMRSEINWWPMTPGKVKLFRRALNFFGSGWRRKLLGA